jgi:hypothetical protein
MIDSKPSTMPLEIGLKLSSKEDPREVYVILYRYLVGSMIYLTYTRSKFNFVVNLIYRHMTTLKVMH